MSSWWGMGSRKGQPDDVVKDNSITLYADDDLLERAENLFVSWDFVERRANMFCQCTKP